MTDISPEGKRFVDNLITHTHKYAFKGAIENEQHKAQVVGAFYKAKFALEHYIIKLENE